MIPRDLEDLIRRDFARASADPYDDTPPDDDDDDLDEDEEEDDLDELDF